jgi:hypothetical protein
LFEAGTYAVGWYALLLGWTSFRSMPWPRLFSLIGVGLGVLYILDPLLPEAVRLIAPLASIGWTLWLGLLLWREAPSPDPP